MARYASTPYLAPKDSRTQQAPVVNLAGEKPLQAQCMGWYSILADRITPGAHTQQQRVTTTTGMANGARGGRDGDGIGSQQKQATGTAAHAAQP